MHSSRNYLPILGQYVYATNCSTILSLLVIGALTLYHQKYKYTALGLNKKLHTTYIAP